VKRALLLAAGLARQGPQRVSPGEVATHARNLLQHCGMRVLSEQRA
jgi:hypothetical protein